MESDRKRREIWKTGRKPVDDAFESIVPFLDLDDDELASGVYEDLHSLYNAAYEEVATRMRERISELERELARERMRRDDAEKSALRHEKWANEAREELLLAELGDSYDD